MTYADISVPNNPDRHRSNVAAKAARAGSEHGFGLLELTMLLAALVILSAAVAPAMLRTLHDARQRQAEQEMRAVYQAIVGNEQQGTFGFVGDVGRFPIQLEELSARGALPLFTVSPASGVGYGWNGPYVHIGRDASDFELDPWGKPYDLGVVGANQLRSAGPDGVFDDADDLVFPPRPVNPYGTLLVQVKAHSGDLVSIDPEGCTVTLHYASEGAEATVVDTTVPYSFTDVARGVHRVDVSCPRLDTGTALESAVAAVMGHGEQQVLELHVDLGSAPSISAEQPAPADGSSEPAPGQGQR